MEQHGKSPKQIVTAIIPARYASTRLPGKLLLPIAGKPLILYTIEQANRSRLIDRVIVATDDDRILNAVRQSGNEAVLTSSDHLSGSDRIAEVAAGLPIGTIVVNVQGDEPMISPRTIDAAIEALLDDDAADMATTCEPISDLDELLDGNVVKVVFGDNGYALYFSRSPMPFPRDASLRYDGNPNMAIIKEPDLMSIFRKHTGLYVFRREYLLKFTELPQSRLERIEMLEQIRALEDGAKIKVVEVTEVSIGVDTAEDLERVRKVLERRAMRFREGTVDDIRQIAKVHVESSRESYSGIVPQDHLDSMSFGKREEMFRERFSEPAYKMLVVEDPAKGIVGFADFGKPRIEGVNFETQIYSFYFLKEYQRRGLGGELFRRCIQEMRHHGIRSMCLDSLEISPYRKFYERMGGEVVGKDSHELGDAEFATVIYGWRDIRK